jgi:uncharacterized membrane protein YccC
LDLERVERVEADLDRLITRRHDQRMKDATERHAEELWRESVRRYYARQAQDLRALWCEHYRKMRGVHWGIGDEYDRKLRDLENGQEDA